MMSEYALEISQGLLFLHNHAIDMERQGKKANSEVNDNYLKYTESIHNLHRITFKLALYLNSKNGLHNKLENEISIINNHIRDLLAKNPPTAKQIENSRVFVDGKYHNIAEVSKEIIADENRKIGRIISLD